MDSDCYTETYQKLEEHEHEHEHMISTMEKHVPKWENKCAWKLKRTSETVKGQTLFHTSVRFLVT